VENNQKRCYLCGKQIEGVFNLDHVPPKQFFPLKIRRLENPNLIKLPTHIECNSAYQLDEDYFIHSIGTLAQTTETGTALFEDIKRKTHNKQGLIRTVVREFNNTSPNGIILPYGKMWKSYKTKRINNVVWKIIRGLVFIETQEFLDINTPRSITITEKEKKPPVYFSYIVNEKSKGSYQKTFDYKYKQFPEVKNAQIWGLLLWDYFIVTVILHNPKCKCEKCKKYIKGH